MNASEKTKVFEACRAVLRMNDVGTHTQPAPDLYPHQWLWDSCFIAIGIAHYNPQRAAQEIYSLLKGQWQNGMVPHMIFATSKNGGRNHNLDARFWQSKRNQAAPQHIATSGITQPPMIAEACLQISQKMTKQEGQAFLNQVFPRLVAYHQWLYRERDPDKNGVVSLFHPWETGLDNAPKWMEELSLVHSPLWIKTIETLQLDWIIERVFRRDIKRVKSDERMTTINALKLTHVALSLKKQNYETPKILRNPHFIIESLSFNSILIGNNRALTNIAKQLDKEIPEDLLLSFRRSKAGLESLWDAESKEFCHRNYLTGQLTRVEGIARLLPLYSGLISKGQADNIVAELNDHQKFLSNFPVPSVSKSSPHFNPRKYWQGPSWLNTNWLIVKGLELYGYQDEAMYIRQQSIAMVADQGSYEYFQPDTGEGLGAQNFSWTAAVTIDFLKS